MKVLVTGHKGYIGSRLYKDLKRLGHDVSGIDLKDGVDILYCLPDESFDYVFHLAAMPKVSFCMTNPAYTMRQNVFVTSTLLEWAKDHDVKRVIFSSSAAVYGNVDGFPSSPYGLHKLMSEMECRLFSKLYGLDTVCLRYFNVYSEDQPFGGRRFHGQVSAGYARPPVLHFQWVDLMFHPLNRYEDFGNHPEPLPSPDTQPAQCC